jgi:transposase-like protein
MPGAPAERGVSQVGTSKRLFTDKDKKELVRLWEEGMSRNDICRTMGRGAGTITWYAKQAGLDFDRRESLVNAVEIVALDLAARRAVVAEKLMGVVERAVEEIEGEYTVTAVGMVGPGESDFMQKTLKKPPAKERLEMAKQIATLSNESTRLIEYDRSKDAGAHEAKGMLLEFGAYVTAVAEQMETDVDPEGE